MKYLEVTKSAVAFTAGLGISQILTGIVTTTTPTETTYQKVTVNTGKFVLGFVIGEAIDQVLDRKTAQLQSWWHENITTKANS